jgi:hypothetical protein
MSQSAKVSVFALFFILSMIGLVNMVVQHLIDGEAIFSLLAGLFCINTVRAINQR